MTWVWNVFLIRLYNTPWCVHTIFYLQVHLFPQFWLLRIVLLVALGFKAEICNYYQESIGIRTQSASDNSLSVYSRSICLQCTKSGIPGQHPFIPLVLYMARRHSALFWWSGFRLLGSITKSKIPLHHTLICKTLGAKVKQCVCGPFLYTNPSELARASD